MTVITLKAPPVMGNKMRIDVKARELWPQTRKHATEYLAGLIAGDGQIEKKRVTITDSHREFLEAVLEKVLRRQLGLNATIHKRSDANAYYMRIYGKNWVSRIGTVLTMLKSQPTTNFIRGFFDAEGTISIEQGKYVVIEINQHEAPLIANISLALRDRCIYPYIRYQEYFDRRRGKTYTRYVLRIKRKSSVYRFLTRIGLRHPKHMKILGLRPL